MADSIRDSLEGAFEQHEATPQPAVSTPAAPATPATGEAATHRSSDGRFAKPEPNPGPTSAEPKTYSRPQAWRKDFEADWGGLPNHVQAYITERESQAATGIHQYKSQYEQAKPIYDAVTPFLQELSQHGQDPAKWLGELGNFNRVMAFGSPEQKLQTLMSVAQAYGVALPQNGQANPQLAQMMQQMQQLQGQMRGYETERIAAEEASVHQQIEDNMPNMPHFEEARETMGRLVQSGMATGLQEAYDMAVRMNPELWKAEQARQASEAEAQHQAAIATKKAKAVSPRSSTPTANTGTSGGKKSIRENLFSAFDQHSDAI